MPRRAAELWCGPELSPDLRRALEQRGLRVGAVVPLSAPVDAAAVPAPARGTLVVVVVLDGAPSSAVLDALAEAARAAKTICVLTSLGAGPARAPVLRALAARRGLAYADDLSTLIDLAVTVAEQGRPRGDRVAVIARSSLLAREVSAAAQRRRLGLVSSGPRLAQLGGAGSPVVLAPRTAAAALRRALVADDAFDVVAWIGPRPAGATLGAGVIELEAAIPDGLPRARRGAIGGADRLVALLAALLPVGGAGAVTTPADAASAGRRKPPPVADRDATLEVLDGPRRVLSDPSSKRALTPYGIAFVKEALCTSPSSAERAAKDLTPPLVAKVASPDLPMGPDAPGIVTGIPNAPQARTAYHTALRGATNARSGMRVLGVRILEDPVGVAKLRVRLDRGPDGVVVLRVGGHGPAAAVVGDLELALPASRDDLACLVDALPWSVLWSGANGRPAGDHAALLHLLARVGAFADDLVTRVSQVILDPVVVLEKGQGALAIDAQVTVG